MAANKVIAIYRAKPGKDKELAKLVMGHHPRLVALGYATGEPPLILRSPKDGTILELFSWKSDAHVARAHKDPAIMEIWNAFGAISDYLGPGALAEAKDMFPHFEVLSPPASNGAGAKEKTARQKAKPKQQFVKQGGQGQITAALTQAGNGTLT